MSHRKQILVLRTEHLEEDFESLNDWLAVRTSPSSSAVANYRQNGLVWMESDERTGQHHLVRNGVATDRSMSVVGSSRMCCALQEEMGIYKWLVQSAANLSPNSKQVTFDSVSLQCGFGPCAS